MVTYLTWTALRFGKYEGKTLPQIVLTDPDYFFWASERGIFRDPQDSEAEEIAYRARHIKIPKPDPENWRVEYEFSLDHKFVNFSIIDAKTATSIAPYNKIGTHLDLSLPREMKTYDKLGSKLMLANFRNYYFDGSNLTKEKCENFFYRSKNFIWRKDEKVIPDSNAG